MLHSNYGSNIQLLLLLVYTKRTTQSINGLCVCNNQYTSTSIITQCTRFVGDIYPPDSTIRRIGVSKFQKTQSETPALFLQSKNRDINNPVNTTHLYDIYTMLDQRLWRWYDIV